MTIDQWARISEAAFVDDVCVVPTRYGGTCEGGVFAALPVADLPSEAFGGDVDAAQWWRENAQRVGVGDTPNDALIAWHINRQKQRSK